MIMELETLAVKTRPYIDKIYDIMYWDATTKAILAADGSSDRVFAYPSVYLKFVPYAKDFTPAPRGIEFLISKTPNDDQESSHKLLIDLKYPCRDGGFSYHRMSAPYDPESELFASRIPRTIGTYLHSIYSTFSNLYSNPDGHSEQIWLREFSADAIMSGIAINISGVKTSEDIVTHELTTQDIGYSGIIDSGLISYPAIIS